MRLVTLNPDASALADQLLSVTWSCANSALSGCFLVLVSSRTLASTVTTGFAWRYHFSKILVPNYRPLVIKFVANLLEIDPRHFTTTRPTVSLSCRYVRKKKSLTPKKNAIKPTGVNQSLIECINRLIYIIMYSIKNSTLSAFWFIINICSQYEMIWLQCNNKLNQRLKRPKL